MPAMSPTMMEGNIAMWKVKEGARNNHSVLRDTQGGGLTAVAKHQGKHLRPGMCSLKLRRIKLRSMWKLKRMGSWPKFLYGRADFSYMLTNLSP